MKRYRVVTVAQLNTEGKWVVPGTYTLESARRMVNIHRKLAGGRVTYIEDTEPRKQRHAYDVELTFDSGLVRRQWIREYPPEKVVQQVIRSMGSRLASSGRMEMRIVVSLRTSAISASTNTYSREHHHLQSGVQFAQSCFYHRIINRLA